MQQQTLGIVAPVPKGEWTSLANYQKLNIVRRNGASYMATAANTDIQPGVDPGWESYWMLLNEDGQGEEGAQGPAGPGVPTGGLQGEVLVKSSNTNYDTGWVPQSQIAAGSAENDGDGNNIVATYETKSDATAKNTNLQNQITQNVQNIEQNAQIGSRNAKRLDGLEQRINPSPFVTDSTVAYQKNVPSNAVGAVEIQSIGGMTYRDATTNTLKNSPVTAVKSVGANLITNNTAYGYIDSAGVYQSASYQTNQSCLDYIPVNGTITAHANVVINTIGLAWYDGNKNFLSREQIRSTKSATRTVPDGAKFVRVFASYDQTQTTVWSFASIELMLNRGSTALPYSPYTESALPIPAAVQALDGYGEGVNESVYNYIDWDKKQFVKRVGKVDMGTLSWAYNALKVFQTNSLGAIGLSAMCSKYEFAGVSQTGNSEAFKFGNKKLSIFEGDRRIYVRDDDYTDVETFKAAMSGVMLYYELATPEVTDISELITSDNLLPVQGNGVLIFENANAQAVPSTVEFITAEATA